MPFGGLTQIQISIFTVSMETWLWLWKWRIHFVRSISPKLSMLGSPNFVNLLHMISRCAFLGFDPDSNFQFYGFQGNVTVAVIVKNSFCPEHISQTIHARFPKLCQLVAYDLSMCLFRVWPSFKCPFLWFFHGNMTKAVMVNSFCPERAPKLSMLGSLRYVNMLHMIRRCAFWGFDPDSNFHF